MMQENRFALVPFHGAQLLTIHDGDQILVAMRPLVEALGISWSRQRKKILGDPVLSQGVALRATPSEGGAQEAMMLPIGLMQGWLFKISPSNVTPEARERIIAYQRECYQVLHDYWTKGAAINPRHQQVPMASTTEMVRLIEATKLAATPGVRRALFDLIDQQYRLRGLQPPALEDLIHPATARMRNALASFMQGWRQLEAMGIDIDLHRRSDRIAFHLPWIDRLMLDHAIERRSAKDLRAALSAHPAFIAARTVNCRDGKTRHCWVMDSSFGASATPQVIH